MKATRHEGKSLLYLAIEPDDYDPAQDYPMIVLLHGFGANMNDLANPAPAISRDGYVFACPQAPMEFDFGGGMVGYGWTARGPESTPEQIQDAEDRLATFFSEVIKSYRVAPGRAMLMGFSQGGGMTYRCGLTDPDRFAGLAVLSGTLPDPEHLRARLPADRSQPVFISHGVNDPILPLERGRLAKEFLDAEGYNPVYNEYVMGHEINPEVLRDLTPWAAGVLPPLVPASR